MQQQFATFRAAGSEIEEEWPSLDAAQTRLDEALNAEPELVARRDPREQELYDLLGVG